MPVDDHTRSVLRPQPHRSRILSNTSKNVPDVQSNTLTLCTDQVEQDLGNQHLTAGSSIRQ
jgi:hypothetical protein